MNSRSVAQVSIILLVGLGAAYGLSVSLRKARNADPTGPAGGAAAGAGGDVVRAVFAPADFSRPEFVQAIAETDFAAIEASRVEALIYLAGMNRFFTQHSASFDRGECASLARGDLGATASRAVYERLGWPTRPDAYVETLLTTLGAVSRTSSRIVVSAEEVAKLRRDGMSDGKVMGEKYGCEREPVRHFYAQAVSYVHDSVSSPGGTGAGTNRQPSPAPSAPGSNTPSTTNPFDQFSQVPNRTPPASGGTPGAYPDPFGQFQQLPPGPAPGAPPGSGPAPPRTTFNTGDFQRPDIIDHLRSGNFSALEPMRVAVHFYLTAMNQFFMDQSALFDDGSCTALADPRLGLVATQSLYKSLGWGSLQKPDMEAMLNTLAPLLMDLMQNPGDALLRTAEIDVLRNQGEMDGKILALRYQCSTPAVRTLYENAKRFVYGS